MGYCANRASWRLVSLSRPRPIERHPSPCRSAGQPRAASASPPHLRRRLARVSSRPPAPPKIPAAGITAAYRRASRSPCPTDSAPSSTMSSCLPAVVSQQAHHGTRRHVEAVVRHPAVQHSPRPGLDCYPPAAGTARHRVADLPHRNPVEQFRLPTQYAPHPCFPSGSGNAAPACISSRYAAPRPENARGALDQALVCTAVAPAYSRRASRRGRR